LKNVDVVFVGFLVSSKRKASRWIAGLGEERRGPGRQRINKLTRNTEQIPAILVGEHVIEFIESGPCDAAQTQRAWFMGREENAVFCLGTVTLWDFEELLDTVDLAV
jgi:hypothetical protein